MAMPSIVLLISAADVGRETVMRSVILVLVTYLVSDVTVREGDVAGRSNDSINA
jgi:hypothetical protein